MSSLKCNCCWEELERVAYITICSHVFCRHDAEKYFSKELACPLCDTPLSSSGGIHEVQLNVPSGELAFPLLGFSPQTIVDTAQRAIEFWVYQKQTEIEHHKVQLKKKDTVTHQIEKQYNEKLVELQNQINILHHQFSSTKDENDRLKKDLQETQEKYTEKARQKRKLAELYENLKRKVEQAGLGKNIETEDTAVYKSPSLSKKFSISPALNNYSDESRIPRKEFSSSFSAPSARPTIPKPTLGFKALFQKKVSETSQAPHNKPSSGFSDRFSMARGSSPNSAPFVTKNTAPIQKLFATPKRPETPSFARRSRRYSDGDKP